MNVKIRKIIIHMSKMAVYAIILCATISVSMAYESTAQRKSLAEIDVEIESKKGYLLDVLRQIESSTNFKFAYSKSELKKKLIILEKSSWRMNNLLREISSQGKISFRRVNEVITIKKADKSAFLPDVSDVVIADITVSGTITDESGEGLPGATVIEKGTNNGTITDVFGKYSLKVEEDAILVISFVGFKEMEVPLAGRSVVDVKMLENLESLEEVVVIGYGSQKRTDVTGSVASVKGDVIARQGTVNVTQALQGQVPGVTVVNTSGAPGSGASILIRGQGSYGSIAPLYIVDGAITSGINFINPNDISSIEVLKDASAAAIYGSQAANGVVIVTTKRGKSGETKVSFTINSGIQTLANKLDLATSQEWRDKEVWKFENEGVAIPENLQADNFDPSVSTDWEDVLFSPALQQDYNLQFSGGGLGSNFNLSLGFTDQDGILVESEYQRLNLRLNSDFVVGRFKVGESFSVNRTESASVVSLSSRGWPVPIVEAQDADGNYGLISEGWGANLAPFIEAGNPLAMIELTDRATTSINIVGNVYGQVELLEGLTAKTSVSVQLTNTNQKTFTPEYTVEYLTNPIADLTERRTENYSWLWENTLNYAKIFGDHSFGALVGWTRQFNQTNFLQLNAEGFPAGLSVANAAETILPTSSGTITESAIESYLGRLNYSYKEKYQLTATIRQDASSRLIEDLRTGVFPSFSLGWVASNESFFPKVDFINRLKFRGGYGELGRLNAVGAYQVQNTLALGGNGVDYILGSSQEINNGVTQGSITNENILWERAQSSNIAMEASLFGDKVSLTAEYFVKNTKDLQFNSNIPMTVGTTSSNLLINAGDIQNKGFELNLGYNGSKGDFNYNVTGNLFVLRNEVLAFNDTAAFFVGGQYGFGGQNATRAEVGRELSNFWLLRTDGMFNSQEEVDAHSKDGELIQPNAQPGDLRFKDINGDGRIDEEDKEFISGSIPDFEYGFNVNASYKSFDMSIILQGVVGQKIFNGVGRILGNTLKDQSTDYWREDNLDAKYFRPSVADPNGNNGDNDFFLEDASYLRLRNVQIGYTLPQSLLSKVSIESARLSITGQNLLTITKFSGYDPENISFGLNRGVNTNVSPLTKTVIIGLAVNF